MVFHNDLIQRKTYGNEYVAQRIKITYEVVVKMKKRKEKKTAAERISAVLDVSLDMVADVPRFTMNDNRELSVENYKSIEGYEPEEIRLRSKQYRIVIAGSGLNIVAITDEEILIRGCIKSLSFD